MEHDFFFFFLLNYQRYLLIFAQGVEVGGKEKNGFALSSLILLFNLLQNILQFIMLTAALGQVLEGMLQEVTLMIQRHTQA